MKKFCPNCGTELTKDIDFCPNCGFHIAASESASSSNQLEHSEVPEPDKKIDEYKVQIFCPNCGHVLKSGAEFCSNCGYDLKNKQAPSSDSTVKQTSKITQPVQIQSKSMKKSTKILLSIVGVLLVALIGFYIWGNSYFSLNNQVDRITSGLSDPKQDISKYVIADSQDMNVNNNTIKPLQNYYKEHQTTVTKLNTNLKNGEGNSTIQLVKTGRYWLLFPKYQLRVKTYQPQVVTNHSNSQVIVNGKNIGQLSSNSDRYYKKLSLIFPGKYHVVVNSKVAGRNLSATSTANIWSNKTLNMDIATQTFKVKSVPKGDVYINDKKVGTLDSDGETTFKSYPITRNMELYVIYNNNGKNIKSETVTDMASEFGTFSYGYYDDDDYYNDDASDQSSNDVVKTNDGYVVEPKWKGVISNDDAEQLIGNAFSDPDDKDFVNGSANKDYNDIKSMEHSWDKSDSIDSYDTDVEIVSVYPASDKSCNVIFRVTYTFDNDDDTSKKQIMEYTGGIIQKVGNVQKIKTIGNGKVISSKNYDD